MPIKKNYLDFKLKGLRDNNITSLDDDDDLNKPLSNNKGFDNKSGKV
jgi:hypothetical protein